MRCILCQRPDSCRIKARTLCFSFSDTRYYRGAMPVGVNDDQLFTEDCSLTHSGGLHKMNAFWPLH